MKIYIYALTDPREPLVVRYVGQSSNLGNRFATHYRGGDPQTKAWVKDIIRQGFAPTISLLEETDDFNATNCERKWINHYRETVLNIKAESVKDFEFRVSPIISLREMEIRYIQWALNYCHGNKLEASRLLGIGRQTLYNKLSAMQT